MINFSSIPIYYYYILIAVIGIFIYFYLDENQRRPINSFFKRFGIYILIIVGWFVSREYLGTFSEGDFFYKKANAYALICLMLYGLVVNFLGTERYKSTHAICDNRSGSCATYEPKGDYVVLNIGSVDADLFPYNHGHETWVVPKRHFHKINRINNSVKTQIFIDTLVSQADLNEVPAYIADFIQSTGGYNKENIYYGEFSLAELRTPEKIDGLSKTDYELKLRDTNRLLNENRTMLKGKTSAIKNFVSDASTIRKKAEGKSVLKDYEMREGESS